MMLIHKIIGKLKLEIMHSSSGVSTLLMNQALQTRLLDFINDAFITELLTGITYYMHRSENPEHKKHAEAKAKDLLSQIKKFSI